MGAHPRIFHIKSPVSSVLLLISYPYKEYQTVESEKDIKNLMEVSGYFHDAWITEISPVEDGIKVLFSGVWECKIFLLFHSHY